MIFKEGLEKTASLQGMFDSDCVSPMCMDVLTMIHVIEGHGFCFQL